MSSKNEMKLMVFDPEMSMNKIDPSNFNPPKRISPMVLDELRRDIKKVGVLNPILLVEKKGNGTIYEIADGHRRFSACRALGKKTIPAIVTRGNTADIYSRQFITRRPSGSEVIYVYRKEPNALPSRIRTELDNFMEKYGEENFFKLSDKGATANTFRIIRRIDGYMSRSLLPGKWGDRNKRDNLVRLAHWMIDLKQQGVLNALIKTNLPSAAKQILKAIETNTDLVFAMSTKEP